MSLTATPCSVYRGGTSKGLYFLASDLPADRERRDAFLLRAMGSPDARQIDGMGGAHPLTSKVAVVGPSLRDDADVDYLFLQVVVDEPDVRDTQNCGNILAAVAPFAIEQGLITAGAPATSVRIHMVNSGSIAVAHIETPDGAVRYDGDARIDGVPGTAAPVMLDFEGIAGANCGALLPTGKACDDIDGVTVTCIDNGMPVVILDGADFGINGDETPAAMEADAALKQRIEALRLAAGERMNLGDVRDKTVPKMSLVTPARRGGAINTRSFIPHRVHESIGVLGAASIAAACLIDGSVAQRVAGTDPVAGSHRFDVEHPTGFLTVEMTAEARDDTLVLTRTSLLRTARKLMTGDVYTDTE